VQGGELLAVGAGVVVLGLPLLLSRMSRMPRGVRTGPRARHPFRVPGRPLRPGMGEDRTAFDDRDIGRIPPVQRRARKRRPEGRPRPLRRDGKA
jgi:hypothetical protein